MSSLSLDDIANLLGDPSLKPKPKQVGPVHYNREYNHCSRCGVACGITVEGTYYCTSHALYAINELILPDTIIEDCTCDVGRRTAHSLHTSDCAIYGRLPE